jgi:hypothetical protein
LRRRTLWGAHFKAGGRRELAEEVEERRRKLEEVMRPGSHPGMAERLAIEATLINRGLLRLTKGGWC